MSANGFEFGIPVVVLTVLTLWSCFKIPYGIGRGPDRRRMLTNRFVWLAVALSLALGTLAVCIVIWAPVRLKGIALPAAFMTVFTLVLISKRVRGIALR